VRSAVAAAVCALSLAWPGEVRAQWRVGVGAGVVAIRGASAPAPPGDSVTVRPYGPLIYGADASYTAGVWQGRVSAASGISGLSVGTGDLFVVDRSGLKLLLIEPTVARRVAVTGEHAAVWLEAGPSVHVWYPTGADSRLRIGVVVAAAWRQRARGKVDSTVRLFLSASPSPFEASDLPAAYRPSTLWRFGVTFGVDRLL
jgi:hypothetical protein